MLNLIVLQNVNTKLCYHVYINVKDYKSHFQNKCLK